MKFQKKPVVIEAEQFFPHEQMIWPTGVEGHKSDCAVHNEPAYPRGACDCGSPRPNATFWIGTLEDSHEVTPGDWIITGVKGEKYPCKPDIFEATYEPVVFGAAVSA